MPEQEQQYQQPNHSDFTHDLDSKPTSEGDPVLPEVPPVNEPIEISEGPTPEDSEQWDDDKARAIGFAVNQAENNISEANKLQSAATELLGIVNGNQGEESQGGAEEQQEARVAELDEAMEDLIEQAETPFEKLYDLNPEYFNNLPTAEFVKIAKEIMTWDINVERFQGTIDTLDHRIGVMEEAIQAKEARLAEKDVVEYHLGHLNLKYLDGKSTDEMRLRDDGLPVYREDLDTMYSEYKTLVRLDRDPTLLQFPRQFAIEIFHGLRDIASNAFDTTPRQKVEAHSAILRGIRDRVQKELLDRAKLRRDEIFMRFTPGQGETNSEESQVA